MIVKVIPYKKPTYKRFLKYMLDKKEKFLNQEGNVKFDGIVACQVAIV